VDRHHGPPPRTALTGASGTAPDECPIPDERPRYSPITAQSIPIMMKKPVNIEMSAIAP